MRLVKIAAAVVGGLLVLLVIAVVAVAWLFDPNDYKDTIAAEFEQRTGRTLAIERDLALEYLPWLAVETGGVVVGNAPGFSDRDFARIEHVEARLELWPLLLSREIRVGTIVVDGLELNLEVDAEGRGNWTFTTAADDPTAAPDAAAGSSPLETLGIDGLRVRDATVSWRDLGAGREYTLSDLAITSGAYHAGEPVDVEAAFGFADSETGTQASIEAGAAVDYVPGTGLALRGGRTRLDLETPDGTALRGDLRFEAIDWRTDAPLTMTGTRLTGSVMAPALGDASREMAASFSRAELDLEAGSLAVDDLVTSVGAIEARWQLTGRSLLDAPRLEGSVAVAQARIAAILSSLGVAAPSGVDAAALGTLDLSSRFELGLDPFELALADVETRALGASITGNVTVADGEPRVRGSFAAPAFAPSAVLRTLLAPYVPEGVDLDAFERVALAAAFEASPSRSMLALRDLRAELLGATLTGNAELSFADGGLGARGRLASSGIAPRAFEAAFGTLLTDTVDPSELGTLSFDTGFDYDAAADRLALDPLALGVFGLEAKGALTAAALTTSPVYTGHASVARFEPRDLMRRFGQAPPQTSDSKALGTAAIDTRFEVTPERGDFRDLVLRLDDSRITGEFAVLDFDNPAYRFTLAIDKLDADRYLPPPADEAAAGERRAGDLELTGEALDLLDLDGRVEVGTLRLAGLSFAQVATRMTLGRGVVRLEDAAAELYGGRFAGAFGIDSTGDVPRMTLNGRAEGLALAPIITDLTGDANFSGTGDFDLALAGTGVTVTDNVRSAAGTMGFTMRDGAIEGFDLGRSLCAAYNVTQKLPKPPNADVDRTRYQLLSGKAEVAGGVATSPDLLARAAFMDVTGRGSIDLLEQKLDYELEAKLTGSIDIPNCSSMDRLVGDSIPLTLKGTLAAPEILPDFGEILRREIRDRAKEKVEDRLRDRLRDLL